MEELLKEQLKEYETGYAKNEAECIKLMKDGKPWLEKAKKGAGFKLMIDYCKNQIKILTLKKG